jgi:serine/threonine protein kinase
MQSHDGWVLDGRYHVIDRIGAGAMAEVFGAHDSVLGRDVAVKVFRSHVDNADGSDGMRRREVEMHALAGLNHPNLITLYDASTGGDGQPAFIVMELVDGPTLAERLATAPLAEAEARQLAVQIADALAYVHAQGMVHRDVKPANILLGSTGVSANDSSGDPTARARLSDFGIVRMLGTERLTSADLMVGTASYLSPEQARGLDVGAASDVYALGLVMIEALAGVRSFPGTAQETVLARLTQPPDIPNDIRAPWPGLLRSMTATDPSLRPTASEVAERLRSDHVTPVVPVTEPASDEVEDEDEVEVEVEVEVDVDVEDPRRRRRAALALSFAPLLALLAAAAMLLLKPSHNVDAPPDTRRPTSSTSHPLTRVTPNDQSASAGRLAGTAPIVAPTTSQTAKPSATTTRSTATASVPASATASADVGVTSSAPTGTNASSSGVPTSTASTATPTPSASATPTATNT